MMYSAFPNVYRATLVSRRCLLLPGEVSRIPGGVWVHGACTRLAVLAQTISGLLASFRVSLVPAQQTAWEPPCEPALVSACLDEVARVTGRSARSWAVQLPQDRRRRRFNLLLLDEERRPYSFIKFTANALNPRATAMHRRFAQEPPLAFWAPAYQASGDDGSWYYLALTAMPNLPHGPARLSAGARRRLLGEIQATGSADEGRTLVAVHGDFGPWNVRRLINRRVAVVDWEELTTGPPAADELWHSITWWTQRARPIVTVEKVLRELELIGQAEIGLAASYWMDRLSQPETAEIDQNVAMPPRLAAYSNRLEETLRLVIERT